MNDEALRERLRQASEAIPVPPANRSWIDRRGRYLKSRRYVLSGAMALVLLAGIVIPLRLLVFTSPARTASSGRLATLQVLMTQQETGLRGEGYFTYVVVENKAGKRERLIEQRGVPSTPLPLRISPGTYTIASYQRTCSFACPHLDPNPPFGRCTKVVTVRPGDVLNVAISVRPYDGCTMAVQP